MAVQGGLGGTPPREQSHWPWMAGDAFGVHGFLNSRHVPSKSVAERPSIRELTQNVTFPKCPVNSGVFSMQRKHARFREENVNQGSSSLKGGTQGVVFAQNRKREMRIFGGFSPGVARASRLKYGGALDVGRPALGVERGAASA